MRYRNVVLIDEREGNPFTRDGELEEELPYLDENDCTPISYTRGYYIGKRDPTREDIERVGKKQRKVSSDFLNILGARGKFLDIGYGRNPFVALGAGDAGMEPYALTSSYGCYYNLGDEGVGEDDLVPRHARAEELSEEDKVALSYSSTLKLLRGDILYALHPRSAIKDEKFGMQVIWGAYFTSGNNYIIEYNMEYLKKAGKKKPDKIVKAEFPSEEYLFKIIRNLADRGSGFSVVSSRYCYRGQGMVPMDMPREKILFLNLAEKVRKALKGEVKKVIFMGISKDAWKEKVKRSRKSYRDNYELDYISAGVLRTFDPFSSTELLSDSYSDIDIALIDSVTFIFR